MKKILLMGVAVVASLGSVSAMASSVYCYKGAQANQFVQKMAQSYMCYQSTMISNVAVIMNCPTYMTNQYVTNIAMTQYQLTGAACPK